MFRFRAFQVPRGMSCHHYPCYNWENTLPKDPHWLLVVGRVTARPPRSDGHLVSTGESLFERRSAEVIYLSNFSWVVSYENLPAASQLVGKVPRSVGSSQC